MPLCSCALRPQRDPPTRCRASHMPFVLVFAVLVGAGGLIAGAIAAPTVDLKNCHGHGKHSDSRDGNDGDAREQLQTPSGLTPPIAEE